MALQSIQRLQRPQHQPNSKRPQAVLDETGQQSIICEANALAMNEGVEIGMRPAQALARCSELDLLVRSIEAEAPVERILHLLASALGPRVEATAFGIATIDLHGQRSRQFEAAAEEVLHRFKTFRLHPRIGIADTPEHARWSAFFAKPILHVQSIETFLKHVPLTLSDADPDLLEILNGWGIHTMFALRQLPRDAVGHRLGQRGLQLWDVAAGRQPRLLQLTQTKPKFQRSLSFEHRIESLSALLFTLKRFIDELALELETAQAAAYILELQFKLDDKSEPAKRIEVPEPSSRAATLFRILETALEGFQTSDAIIGICLRLKTTEARAHQGDFFNLAMEDAAGFAETADRIATIVGPNRSGSPRLRDSWRPDAFYLSTINEQTGKTIKPKATPQEAPDPRLGLPLSRYRPPRAIKVLLEKDRPIQIASGLYAGEIQTAKGPWKASGEWWSPSPWAREEWDVELKQGGLFRIFHQRKQWYLEGIYG